MRYVVDALFCYCCWCCSVAVKIVSKVMGMNEFYVDVVVVKTFFKSNFFYIKMTECCCCVVIVIAAVVVKIFREVILLTG